VDAQWHKYELGSIIIAGIWLKLLVAAIWFKTAHTLHQGAQSPKVHGQQHPRHVGISDDVIGGDVNHGLTCAKRARQYS